MKKSLEKKLWTAVFVGLTTIGIGKAMKNELVQYVGAGINALGCFGLIYSEINSSNKMKSYDPRDEPTYFDK